MKLPRIENFTQQNPKSLPIMEPMEADPYREPQIPHSWMTIDCCCGPKVSRYGRQFAQSFDSREGHQAEREYWGEATVSGVDKDQLDCRPHVATLLSLSEDVPRPIPSPAASHISAIMSTDNQVTARDCTSDHPDNPLHYNSMAEDNEHVRVMEPRQSSAQDKHNRVQGVSREKWKRWHELLQIFRDKGIKAADAIEHWKPYTRDVGDHNRRQHWLRRTITEGSIYIYFTTIGKKYAELLEEQNATGDTSDASCAHRWRQMVAAAHGKPMTQEELFDYRKPMSSLERKDRDNGYKCPPSSAEGKLERMSSPLRAPKASE